MDNHRQFPQHRQTDSTLAVKHQQRIARSISLPNFSRFPWKCSDSNTSGFHEHKSLILNTVLSKIALVAIKGPYVPALNFGVSQLWWSYKIWVSLLTPSDPLGSLGTFFLQRCLKKSNGAPGLSTELFTRGFGFIINRKLRSLQYVMVCFHSS